MRHILVMAPLDLLLSFASLLLILLMPHPTSSQPNNFYKQCLDEYGHYTTNSTYQKNLKALLPNLTSDTQITNGFYNLSYGEDSDRAYALGLCRGDVKPESCRSCLNNSTVLLPKLCPDQKDSIGGYDECMLRYSDSANIYRIQYYRHFSFCFSNKTSALAWDKFSAVLTVLLERLRRTASVGGLRKYAAGSAQEDEGSRSLTIYAYVQCLPDVTESECDNCLVAAVSKISNCSRGRIGGRIIIPICNLRYDNYRFYNGSIIAYAISIPPQQPPSSSPRHNHPFASSPSGGTTFPRGQSNKYLMIMAMVVPSVACVVLLIFVCIYLRMRKTRKAFASEAETDNEIQSIDSLQFDFETIKVATNNFSDVNKLGQGGFGPVYKGRLSNGQEVAVKRLSNTSGQGEIEFKNEVLIMSKLQHRNLVRLLGFCFEREERLLIYEFLPNRSLDCFIFDPIKRAHLDWGKWHQIIEGIARGLLYLHEDSQQRIIHRDLKASNILLDAELNPKISDFGMARLIDQTQANTNRIVGTYGYMAPEYAIHGKFSAKSDVFSFGVLILEIVSGQRNNGFRNGENVEHLLSFAWKNWRRGTSSKIVDNTLNNSSRYEIMRCIHIGLLCVQKSVAKRPTLASIVVMLSSNSFSLSEPLQPAFFMDNTRLSDKQRGENSPGTTSEQENNSIQLSIYEVSITEPHPR